VAGQGLGHGVLDRADVGDDGAGLQGGGRLAHHRAHGQHRGGEDDEVGAVDGLGDVVGHAVGEAELAHAGAHRGLASVTTISPAAPALAGGVGHGRADQAAADDGDPGRRRRQLRSCLEELGQDVDHGAVVRLAADGDAQVVGQAVVGRRRGRYSRLEAR
jgi:hypothetical protein